MSDLPLEELSRQAKKYGFRFVPITPLDQDRELFAHCTTREEVRQVYESLPPGYVFETAAIPTTEELDHRQQCKEELIRRGIDPTAPVRTIFER